METVKQTAVAVIGMAWFIFATYMIIRAARWFVTGDF